MPACMDAWMDCGVEGEGKGGQFCRGTVCIEVLAYHMGKVGVNFHVFISVFVSWSDRKRGV